MVVIAMISVPGPVNGYHDMRYNSAATGQNQLDFWTQKAKQIFSQQSKNFGPWANMFGSRPFIAESLKRVWDQQSFIDKQNFALANCALTWTFNLQSFT